MPEGFKTKRVCKGIMCKNSLSGARVRVYDPDATTVALELYEQTARGERIVHVRKPAATGHLRFDSCVRQFSRIHMQNNNESAEERSIKSSSG